MPDIYDRRSGPASATGAYDAVVIVSFGGPEGPDDVGPFLENVTAGRGVPRSRLEAVARQYDRVGGVSPLNQQCRRLRRTLAAELRRAGLDLPVYWGNRNWRPYLCDTVAAMTRAGHRRALALVTSAYSSYSGCRQYLEDIEAARTAAGSHAPVIDKARPYYDHPGFIEPFVDAVANARERLPGDARPEARLVFTAHSIPKRMARSCDYERQLRTAAGLIAAASSQSQWDLVWQSRSGPPSVEWLEPDVNDHLRATASERHPVVLVPIGFVTDHMEVVWDLDTVASETAAELGIGLARAVTPGTGPDPRFVAMFRELIEERLAPDSPRRRLGSLAVRPDMCPPGCCPRS